jgi:tetratricopeptide (TPR) repeat protein
VVKAMAAAYQDGKGTMAERLMDALDAGQAKGGDTRGMQSAGILVMRPLPPNSESTVERIVDIRVDDAEDPFKELRRLLNMTMGVPARLMTRAGELAKDGKQAEAIVELKKALEINPRAENVMYALAQRHAQAGQPDQALGFLETAIKRQPHIWKRQAAADPLFQGLRETPRFKQLVQ